MNKAKQIYPILERKLPHVRCSANAIRGLSHEYRRYQRSEASAASFYESPKTGPTQLSNAIRQEIESWKLVA